MRPLLLALVLAACDTSALPETVMEEMEMQGATLDTLYAGAFVNKGGETTGGAYRIEQSEEGRVLVLDEAFFTGSAPDLHVVLSPLAVEAAGNRNATDGSAILAPLKARTGLQRYPVADSLDLARYRSVLIHCVQYRHLFGAAPLLRH